MSQKISSHDKSNRYADQVFKVCDADVMIHGIGWASA